jgi:hydroxymethylbilane synthase
MQPKNNIRIGTRNSALALWQANHIGSLLEAAGMTYELVAISTIGDKILDRSLSKIGAKGVFTEELETLLRSGEIDIAQHSAKDLPSTLAADLPLLAFTEREAAHDVVLSTNASIRLGQSTPLRIGTSSTRRRAFLALNFPQHTAVEMRGNLQTRLEKLKNGDCDAMLLAFAGVHRMDMEAYIVEHLPLASYVPAVGQGSVAIQCSTQLAHERQEAIRKACNHLDTERCIVAERHLLAQLDGGCSVPVYGHAHLLDGQIHIQAGVLSLSGDQQIESSFSGIDPIATGNHVAQDLINRGAQLLLKEIRQQLASQL